jgi:hypothetical protein
MLLLSKSKNEQDNSDMKEAIRELIKALGRYLWMNGRTIPCALCPLGHSYQ